MWYYNQLSYVPLKSHSDKLKLHFFFFEWQKLELDMESTIKL